mgnify:CR=1 FL=1
MATRTEVRATPGWEGRLCSYLIAGLPREREKKANSRLVPHFKETGKDFRGSGIRALCPRFKTQAFMIYMNCTVVQDVASSGTLSETIKPKVHFILSRP